MNHFQESGNAKRIYAWIIVTSALIIAGLLIWPLTVSQFQTTAVFQFRYEPTSGLKKATLNSLVVQSLREQTDRAALADIFAQMESPLTSSILNSLDPEVIRDSIHVQGRLGSTANAIEYRMSMVGDGSADEIEFVNTVVSRIRRHLDVKLKQENTSQAIAELTDDFHAFHDSYCQQIAGELEAVSKKWQSVEQEFQLIAADLGSLAQYGPQAEMKSGQRSSEGLLNRLMAEREKLLQQPDINPYHPQVVDLTRRIERLTVNQPRLSSRAPDSSEASDSLVVKNRFFTSPTQWEGGPSAFKNVSQQSRNESDATWTQPIERIVEEIRLIDLQGPRSALKGVQEKVGSASNAQVFLERLSDRAEKKLQVPSPIALSRFGMAHRSKPMGGSPGPAQFVILFIGAALVGTLIALNYDHSLTKRPFGSVAQIQRKLNLPVIGVLRTRTTLDSHRPIRQLVAARIVRGCEWTLLAFVVLLILAALANSEVATAFIDNPFQGIKNTFWMMLPGR